MPDKRSERPEGSSHGHALNRLLATLAKTVRQSDLYAPVRRERLRNLTRRPGVYPDWRTLLSAATAEWQSAIAAPKTRRVLIATHVGLHFTANTVDSLLAVALTFRGAQVDILQCDAALSACMIAEHTLAPSVPRFARVGPSTDFCSVCQSAGERLYAGTGISTLRLSDFLRPEDLEAASAFAAEAVRHGTGNPPKSAREEHALAGALRFFGKAALPDDETSTAVYRRYLEAAHQASAAAARLLDTNTYDAVIAHHGIYVPQGLLAEQVKRRGIRLVTWHPAYRTGRLIFQHGDTYHRAMIEEPESAWNRPLGAAEDQELDQYLAQRVTGASDWIAFQRAEGISRDKALASLHLDPARPAYALFANVAWDARLHYRSSAYGDMRDWAIDTVRWFAAHPDRQLIIRCHPGEVLSNPRAQDRLDLAINTAFPTLPENVRLVPPESSLNSYSIAAACRGAMIFNTKMGMELSARGMPVVVAGDAWVRGKGFTHDASSPADYRALLSDPDTFTPLAPAAVARARRYAYHFFFRRCIPVAALAEQGGESLMSLRENAASLAMPGRDAGLDVICEGVLNGSTFEYGG